MPMYTKCPVCHSEIAFEPPANLAEQPDDYLCRIRCPSCGVPIGVKLNKIDRQATYNEPPVNTKFEDVAPDEEEEEQTVPARNIVAAKKPGTARNVLMMILSLAIIACSIVGYIATSKFDAANPGRYYGFEIFNGIHAFALLATDMAQFKLNLSLNFAYVMPMIFFALACVTFVVALISAIGKKYGRAFNLVWAILTFAAGVFMLFAGLFAKDKQSVSAIFNNIINGKLYAMFLPAALGLIQLVLSLFFLKSLNRKRF